MQKKTWPLWSAAWPTRCSSWLSTRWATGSCGCCPRASGRKEKPCGRRQNEPSPPSLVTPTLFDRVDVKTAALSLFVWNSGSAAHLDVAICLQKCSKSDRLRGHHHLVSPEVWCSFGDQQCCFCAKYAFWNYGQKVQPWFLAPLGDFKYRLAKRNRVWMFFFCSEIKASILPPLPTDQACEENL